jgi:HSP20 family molecular chaperone IbpA
MSDSAGCFEINLDVQRFKREDVNIELQENCIVINVRKVKEDDNSIVARKFSKRTYPIELNKYDKNSFVSELKSDGMLKIKILRKKECD